MELNLLPYSQGKEATIGLLFLGDEFLCYTLEDQHRDVKVKGDTRIPAGRYRVTLRTIGGFHERYTAKFPDIHKGMLWLRDVSGFEYILLHVGNNDKDTAGCIPIQKVIPTKTIPGPRAITS